MEKKFAELKSRLAEVHDLRRAQELLFWDQTVFMPPGGGPVRGAQLETLDRIAHEKFVSDAIGALLEELRPLEESLDYDSDEASLIRVTRRDWDKARRVPAELAAEMTRAAADGHDVWAKARQDSDFATFLPALERNVELKRRYIECFAPYEDPYDPLLDDYEPGMKTAEVHAVFDDLKRELIPLIAEVANGADDAFMRGPFDPAAQHELSLELVRRFGFEDDHFRLDRTVHPFAASSARNDIRLTTRYKEDDLDVALHGDARVRARALRARHRPGARADAALPRRLLRAARVPEPLWENVVGRSQPFWRWFYPRLQSAFPDALGGVELDRFYRAVNRVRPSYIRVDADEATYNLHIILRFELELEIVNDRIALKDLPEAWNTRFKEYLGIDVPEDRLGILQDVHWSGGGLGYFPTYSLGNIVSLQIWEKVREALPDLEEDFERGEFGRLHEWLRENLYSLGRKYTPQETLERVVGSGIDAGPYVRYLKSKLGALAAA